jgi:Protein of unknown function (DUF1642).|nr:MAG TPA: Protein of unknown function (DUF1642) [Caudoviricetes sp.]
MKTKLLSGEIPLDFKIFGGFKMVLSKLIKEYKEMCTEYVPVEKVLEDLQKLEGIYKPEDVPKFVADWYEENKDDFEYNLWKWFNYDSDKGNRKNKEFFLWLNSCLNEPVETLVKMKLFGYKVKEEKRYYVKTKKIADGCNYLNCRTSKNEWSFAGISEPIDYRTRHTREELEEAGFGWVFDCPGIEIEEVEE